jgi:hypothetical protein
VKFLPPEGYSQPAVTARSYSLPGTRACTSLQPGQLDGVEDNSSESAFGMLRDRMVLGVPMKKEPGSWLALVAFSLVTTLTSALGFGVLFTGGSVAFDVAQSARASDGAQPDRDRFSQASGNQDVEATVERPAQLIQVDEDGSSSKTFNGMITDSGCGARHSMKSGKSSAECVRSCVRKGAHYVLVDGEENHLLDGDNRRFEQLVGERVRVAGTLEGNTIKVKSAALT